MGMRVVFIVALLGSAILAQDSPTQRFRVAVDAVRIDAVVVDKNNNVVRDLRADDFEVLQDGKPQRVTFTQFVPVTGATSPDGSSGVVSAGAPQAVGSDQGRRTFVIVVDDLGLSFMGIDAVRKGLRRFLDTVLRPTDLVLLVRTGEARSLLQPLTNDREALRATVDRLRYTTASRKGVQPFGDVIQGLHGPEVEESVSGVQYNASIQGTLAALSLVVQAARDLPGRKTVILASEGFPVNLNPGEAMRAPAKDDNSRVRTDVDRLIDQATRSGVVIYAINGAGLRSGGLTAADNYSQTASSGDPFASHEYTSGEAMAAEARMLAANRRDDLRGTQAGLEYLAEQTGGFAVGNTNDLAAAFTRISNDVRDYYVIGYQPDTDTFAGKNETPRLHTVAINVKRPGVRVRARKEFLGISDSTEPAAPPSPAQQLVLAARSPFAATTIPVQVTNLPGYAPGRGLFVRTALHIDANALTFAAGAGNARTATVDLVGLVINNDGVQVDTIATGFDLTVDAATVERMRDGLVYVARVPIKKAGGYQLRFGVRDRRSGAIGSGGGFVNVPDVTGGAFALSGIVLRVAAHGDEAALDSDHFSLAPADARRSYTSGTQLSYSYEVYNAGTALQTQASLWRGPDRITVPLVADRLVPATGGWPLVVAGGLKLPDRLPAGTYVLQLTAATDNPKQPKRPRSAVQRISFDVK